MPIPTPRKGETKKSFISRCMGDDKMNTEFPNRSQRFAVCNTSWKKKSEASADENTENSDSTLDKTGN